MLILSLLALVAADHQYTHAQPTAGPIYYKAINPALFYPGYFQGQVRAVRSEETAEAAPQTPVEKAEERSDDKPTAKPVVYTTPAPTPPPVYPTAAPPPPPPEPRSYPAPAPSAYIPEPSYGPVAYSYEWAVQDDYSKNDYGQKESRNGANTQGSYHVALPDGRVQTVTYTVDGYGGYVVDVAYSGEAQYPATPTPKYKPEARAYKPAPAPYKPSPAPYKPAPTPAPYKPAPTPAPHKPAPTPAPYKPAPTPAPYKPVPPPSYPRIPYRPVPAPSYPVQPAASIRRYSFTTIPKAEAREAPVDETARSDNGIEIELEPAQKAAAATNKGEPVQRAEDRIDEGEDERERRSLEINSAEGAVSVERHVYPSGYRYYYRY